MDAHTAAEQTGEDPGRPENLQRGREAFDRRAWTEAHEALSQADEVEPLGAEDLERLTTSAYLVGRDDDFVQLCDRTHHAFLADENPARAARWAFWAGLSLLLSGQMGPSSGWLARAQRLVEPLDCVEKGYLLLPASEKCLVMADYDSAFDKAGGAASVGERFDDPDLVAVARHLQGRALIQKGEVVRGLELLDEAMVSTTSGDLSPIVTGMVYCSVIEACRQAHEVARARAWTDALSRWCDLQPQMVAFSVTCLANRAGILRLQGAWPDALEEAIRARRRSERHDRRPPGAAFYEQAEIHRLRGEHEDAEAAYREASRLGREPQPGLALLRLAQGRTDAADAAIRRVLESSERPLERARLLPARVEILLAADGVESAHEACGELESIAEGFESQAVRAMADQARGAVQLARGDADGAIASLRRAREIWSAADLPYPTARVRLLMARACRMMGDEDGCELELDAARTIFEKLGAKPDLARVEALARDETKSIGERHGLTPRELQVLRKVATGKTSKAIAGELFVSERTIERHLSNIFTKLGVDSRTAAASYAYENGLI